MENFVFSTLLKHQKKVENQSNQGRVAEVIKRLDEMLRGVNQFDESYK
jgi:hypothetical protein